MPEKVELTVDGLVPILFGFAAFQQLRAGAELGLFESLHESGPAGKKEIAKAIGIGDRSADLLLLGTSALGLTVKSGDSYENSIVIHAMIEDRSWPLFKDVIEFQSRITYGPATDYVESLRTGENIGVRHFPGEGSDLYTRLQRDPVLTEIFYRCVNSWSALARPVLVERIDYTDVRRILDVGCGDAANSIALAQAHPHLQITVLDRPAALEVAAKGIAGANLEDRMDIYSGDIFEDEYPAGYDCILFSHQFVIWSPEQNRSLLRKAHRALQPGGRVLVFNAFSDDDGTGPLYSALDNVYFATLPFKGSMLYPWKDYRSWLTECGYTGIQTVESGTWMPHGVIEGFVPAARS
ncbi:methyltransferase [Nocardia sp. NPDC048505]|uniref:methyltransferase n=1 Tax=Nocardia sp. NPDC048505 TaxID=3155756 RepID=UPI0033CF32C7